MFYGINFLDPRDNFYIMTIILIAIFIAWFVVFTKEASAPPIIIDNTFTRKEQESKLLKSNGGDSSNPVKNSSGVVSTQFPKTGSYGKSGLTFAGLGQPCVTEDNNNALPNLPVSYTTQTCDKSKGLECITGIYQGTDENQGGGICLKIVNQSCEIRSDCSPDASFCLNNLCQTRDEVINKSCSVDKDCTGVLNDFNHVCDLDTKRCVFNIWPRDSGCTSSAQCLHYSKYPDAVTCLTSDGSKKGYLVKIDGVYKGTSIFIDQGSIPTLNSLSPEKIVKSYTEVFNVVTDLPEGRFLITNITGNNVTLQETFRGTSGTSYSMRFGTDLDGICLVKFPLGAPAPNIEGTKDKYDCIGDLNPIQIKSSNQTYCVENKKVRSSTVGSLEQVCTSDVNKLPCDKGLCCTYDNNLISNFGSLIDNYHVIDGVSIAGQFIKDIGKCKKQEKSKFETCEDDCIKPYFCLKESDINDNTFNYCANDWDLMNNISILTGCPDSYFEFSDNDLKCVNKPETFCFNNNDCSPSLSCGKPDTSLKSYVNNFYDPEKGWYKKNDYHFSINQNSKLLNSNQYPKLLNSNQYLDTSLPTFLSYVIKNTNLSWSVIYSLTGDIASSNNTITITFEETPVKEPVFSVFQKQDKTHQLNVHFIEEYENNRIRYFRNQKGDNFQNSGLTEGTSVYFEGFDDILHVSFDPSYINPISSGGIEISSLKNKDGDKIDNPYVPMKTYSNKFGCNFKSNSILFKNHEPTLQNGDRFTYVKGGTGNSISLMNSSGGYTELTEGTCYYSYAMTTGVSQSQNIGHLLYLTEDFNYINFNPSLGTSNFGTSVTVGSSFSTDGNSYLQLQKLYGYRIIPITVPKSGENKTFTINSRKDYIPGELNTNQSYFNLPIGYFSDTDNIKADIGLSSILLTYNYGNNNNQVLNLNYAINSDKQSIYKHNSKIEISDGTCYVINYNIFNSFSPPNLRVISDNYYDEDVFSCPYDLDEVRYFENNNKDSSDTVNFLSTYNNISPTDPRSSIGNISNLRKLNFTTNFFKQGGGYEFDVKYQGLNASINPIQPSVNISEIPFGSSFYISLSEIKQSLLSGGNISQNIFLGGSDVIIFKNQRDIDVILKYGASDLVIGYNGGKNGGKNAIVNIKEYNIDSKGNQTLELLASTYINFGDKLNDDPSPKLYINNIYPMSIVTSNSVNSVNDGRILISSCVPDDYFDKNPEIKYLKNKTSYNKILTLSKSGGENITTHSYFDYYQLIEPSKANFSSMSDSSIFFYNKEPLTTIISGFQDLSENYNMEITAYNNSSPLSDTYIYICNNKFLSLTSISSSSLIYLNNQAYYSTFSVIGKYYSTKTQKEMVKVSGNISFKNDTYPFYTGINGNPGLLDESYLKEISWPYWIKNLNTGSININKIFLNWNPGNMENNMFYYCFVTINNVKMLLYLSTNFKINDIKESQPVPIVIDSFDTISNNLKMLPYNKNILILSKQCVSK